ncbi:MAG: SDR family oxidoreductase [Chloroflexia bacterium]
MGRGIQDAAGGAGGEGDILITGATGNVGAATVAALGQLGLRPRVAARDVAGAQRRLGDTATPVPFDFTDPATFGAAFDGVRRMLLVRPPALANVRRDIAPALDAARAAGVEQVVFLSLLGAERNPVVPHRRIEDLLRASGLGWTFLRASYFMQNLSTTHRDEIRQRGEIFVPAGQGRTSFIDVRDIAAVAAKALTEPGHAGRAYPLTGAVALDYAIVAELLSAVLGRPVRYANPSPLAYARRLAGQGQPATYILVTTAIYLTARLGLAAGVTGDIARLLGREPITMRRFVEDHRALWE